MCARCTRCAERDATDPTDPKRRRRVPVGRTTLELVGPDWPEDRPEERILLWWGLTVSALALAERLIHRDLRGLRVLELGCGLGLSSIAAARAGAHVTLTDLSPDALAHARANAAANGVPGSRIDVLPLDWEDPPAGLQGSFDLVLGAELLYDYASHGALLRLIPGLLAEPGRTPGAGPGRVLLADRPRLVVHRFLGRLRDQGFRGERQDRRLALPQEPPQEVTLWDWAPVAPPAAVR